MCDDWDVSEIYRSVIKIRSAPRPYPDPVGHSIFILFLHPRILINQAQPVTIILADIDLYSVVWKIISVDFLAINRRIDEEENAHLNRQESPKQALCQFAALFNELGVFCIGSQINP